jgi:N-acetylglucosaminyl-diphospho-decaprenol L-rhamnosyltransferase
VSATVPAVAQPAVDVALVVVTHETCDEVLGCLATVGPDDVDELVVVDTGSRDGTAAAVRAASPDARLVELVNTGFGRAANCGVRATSTSVVVVANADVRFASGSLRRLAAAVHAAPERGAVGPRVVYPDGSPQASARRLPDTATALGHALLGRLLPDNRWTRRYRALDVDRERPRSADWLSGCAVALRRSAFDAVDGFDPGYFLYLEDVDLGTRLRTAGWGLWYEPAIEVVHRVGASTSRRRTAAVAHHARGLDRYVRRHRLRGPLAPALGVLLDVGLVLWAVATLVLERLHGSRSTTGERRRATTPADATDRCGGRDAAPSPLSRPLEEVL